MKLYNSLGRSIEAVDLSKPPITVYVCGITPYDTTHLGHAFTYCSADILLRYLLYKGIEVRYAQNVTDIDDDILKRAAEEGQDWKTLGDRWTAHFIEDMVALNVLPPDFYPRATDVIPEIVAAVESIVRSGAGYVVGGNVYYAIDKFTRYGELSGLTYEEMGPIAAERGNFPDDPNKQDPLDFVLWQAHKANEPSWESPWGKGRPGWHIECSTMARKYLGDTIDIHSGGSDLIFPHHESEIAQAEAGDRSSRFVKHWMHTAMVEYASEKMSKSIGNLVMVRDLLLEWPADALRFYLANYHYREVWTYDEGLLARAAQEAELISAAASAGSGEGPELQPDEHILAFEEFMDNDLSAPQAGAVLVELAEAILHAADAGQAISQAQSHLRELAGILGLRLDREISPNQVVNGWEAHLARFQGEDKAGMV